MKCAKQLKNQEYQISILQQVGKNYKKHVHKKQTLIFVYNQYKDLSI